MIRRRPSAAPQLRVHRRFHSHGLRNSRDITVWLPPGYDDPRRTGAARRRHPVVYFQDGQNIFDPATAFLGQAWFAGVRAEELVRGREIVAPILVGVGNTGENRVNEYTPTRGEFTALDGASRRSTGLAKRYARFFVQELMPFIDARYLTLPGARSTAMVGSSMGGLVALYFALWHPRVFGQVAALSPSVWWDNRVVLRDFAALHRKLPVRLWLDTGTAEPGWEGVQLLRDTLVGRGWAQGDDLHYEEVPGAEHHEAAWGARVGDVLKWMLGRENRRPGR